LNKDVKRVAVIPSRAGSKRIKNKNFRNFYFNQSLTDLTINFAIKCNLFDKIIVSTDKINYKNKFTDSLLILKRPKKISQDNSDISQIFYSKKLFFLSFNYIYILQPTSPLRDILEIRNAINWYEKSDYDSFATVSEIDKNFLIFDNKKKLISFCDKKKFFLNGCLYGLKSTTFFRKNNKKILHGSIGISTTLSKQIDIDYDDDFLAAQKLFKQKKNK
jgi:CMP-N,N'-diacetyllegionaminic acid synthase